VVAFNNASADKQVAQWLIGIRWRSSVHNDAEEGQTCWDADEVASIEAEGFSETNCGVCRYKEGRGFCWPEEGFKAVLLPLGLCIEPG
jgi:hypothetical protein